MSTTLQSGLKDDDLAAIAIVDLNLAETDEKVLALRQEWVDLMTSRSCSTEVMYDARRAKDGRPIFCIRSHNGYCESYEGFGHALELLVDAHRTRAEDLEEVYVRLRPLLSLTDEGRAELQRCRSEVVRRRSMAGQDPLSDVERDDAAAIMAARNACARLAKAIFTQNPDASGATRDSLLLQAIERLEG